MKTGMVARLRISEIWTAEDVVRGCLYGALPNKSNSRTIGRVRAGARCRARGRRRAFRPIIMKDPKALAYEHSFCRLVKRARLGAAARLVGATSSSDLDAGLHLLYLDVHVFGNFKRDLDCELLPDLLQKAGIINNDRALRQKRYRWTFQAKFPRVEFEVGYVERGL